MRGAASLRPALTITRSSSRPEAGAVPSKCPLAGFAPWTAQDGWPSRPRARRLVRFRRRNSAHFSALLFQNCLPRKLDPVAFDGQDFHQHLVAFFQFIANIFDSVFGNFADVQQSVQAGQNFNERAEIRQAADLPEISLPYLG